MPDIRKGVIEICFIAKRAMGHLVKFFNSHLNKIGYNQVL
jgi:hypothetical protein